MSVVREFEPVPSRVVGILQYVASCPGSRASRNEVLLAMSPPAIWTERGGGAMVQKVLRECVQSGLLQEQSEEIELSDRARAWVKSKGLAAEGVRDLVLDCFQSPANPENHEFCLALTWLLAQDVFRLRGDHVGVQERLRETVGQDRLKITHKALYANLCYWAVYLGFGWLHRANAGGPGADFFVPDPTRYLERLLPTLFPEGMGHPLPFWTVHERLIEHCGLFQGGAFYEQLKERSPHAVPVSERDQVATALALAWLRLRGRKQVILEHLGDARIAVLPEGDTYHRVTHLSWTGPEDAH